MTTEEAFAILKLDGRTPDADELRRAYLRNVRVTKPEVDPEGFARLREAFELLKQGAPPPFVLAPATGPAMPATPAAPPTEQHEDPFAPYRIWMAGKTAAECLTIARQAVGELPDNTEARWALLSLLEDKSGDEFFRVLLDGAQRRPDEFLLELLWRFPSLAPPAALELAKTRSDFASLMLLANAHAQQHRPAIALQVFTAGLARVEPGASPRARFLALCPVLSLYARQQPAAARQAFAELKQAMGADALDVRSTDHFTALVWTMVDELGRLDPALPPQLRHAAVELALAGDLQNATAHAIRELNTLSNRAARKWLRYLKRDAPTTAELMGLNRVRVKRGFPFRIPRLGGGFVCLVIYWLVKFAVNATSQPSPTHYAPSALTAGALFASQELVVNANHEVAEVCSANLGQPLCATLQTVVTELGGKPPLNCPFLIGFIDSGSRHALPPTPPDLIRAYHNIRNTVFHVCPP